jgi:hypothetical protein
VCKFRPETASVRESQSDDGARSCRFIIGPRSAIFGRSIELSDGHSSVGSAQTTDLRRRSRSSSDRPLRLLAMFTKRSSKYRKYPQSGL